MQRLKLFIPAWRFVRLKYEDAKSIQHLEAQRIGLKRSPAPHSTAQTCELPWALSAEQIPKDEEQIRHKNLASPYSTKPEKV